MTTLISYFGEGKLPHQESVLYLESGHDPDTGEKE